MSNLVTGHTARFRQEHPADGGVAVADRDAWIEEGAHPVAPGIHRIPLPLPSDGLRAVNVYAIEAATGLVLIDSGWALANALDQLERSLAVIGAGLRDVRQFLVTHMHRDHYTQAVEIRQLLGTTIALGAGEQPSIDGLLSGEFRPMRAQLAVLDRKSTRLNSSHLVISYAVFCLKKKKTKKKHNYTKNNKKKHKKTN